MKNELRSRRFAVPVGPLSASLRKKMQVFYIPQLIIMSNKGKVVTKNGRDDLENCKDPLSLWFPELNIATNDNES